MVHIANNVYLCSHIQYRTTRSKAQKRIFMKKNIILIIALVSILSNHANAQKWTETKSGNVSIVANKGGQTLGYSAASGVKILTVDGFAFKDLNKNGKLDKYEDWRRSWDERAKDLSAQLSVEQIAGLMLYS